MEHHRLKPMKPGFDEQLFNKYYKETEALRKKLAFQIDARKFGVDYKEILAWFDVKFIHVFNKYFDTQPDRLLGYLINGLTTYKYRIMRSSYQEKYHKHAHMLDITTLYGPSDISQEDSEAPKRREFYMSKIVEYMKKELSPDALLLFEFQINPPLYITEQLKDEGKKENGNIPPDILIDFLSLPNNNQTIEYIKDLKSEIRKKTNKCQEYFQHNPIIEIPELF